MTSSLWREINARWSEHDSSVFKDSELYRKLEWITLGDSEGISPFLLCPYDKAQPGSAEDVFNVMLFSNRIFVECAFGEIDARFGILWRPLQFKLSKQRFIIDA
jgi:hypothetical protein